MVIPYDILGYIEKNFKDVRISAEGREVSVNSIFTPDRKKKLYINVETGKWICFKTGNKGNFLKLVSIIENISIPEVELKLSKEYAEKYLYKRPSNLLTEKLYSIDLIKDECVEVPYTITNNESKPIVDSWLYLFKRKLLSPAKKYFVGVKGSLVNRLVIPFIVNNHILFYQGRSLYGGLPKYLNCSQSKKSAILYPYSQNDTERVIICEGPIDAISLQQAGVNATCIMGSFVSSEQLIALKRFSGKLVVGFDRDSAGHKGLLYFNKMRLEHKIEELSYVWPPEPYKDWNEALVADIDLKTHVDQNTKIFDFETKISMLISK